MAWPKGKPRPEGAGRKKGTTNKTSAQLKDMILGALSDAGGQTYLLKQARDNPGPFLTLIGKVLPTTLATDPDSPLKTENAVTVELSPETIGFISEIAERADRESKA
jgi:hypothetical protein